MLHLEVGALGRGLGRTRDVLHRGVGCWQLVRGPLGSLGQASRSGTFLMECAAGLCRVGMGGGSAAESAVEFAEALSPDLTADVSAPFDRVSSLLLCAAARTRGPVVNLQLPLGW